MITGIVSALYWFNPLVWFAARRMRLERERACDDMVLNIGCKASDYATHLMEIAMSLHPLPSAGTIAMARHCQLEGRIEAIVDASRARGMGPMTGMGVAALVGAILLAVAGCNPHAQAGGGHNLDQPHTAVEALQLSKPLLAANDALLRDYEHCQTLAMIDLLEYSNILVHLEALPANKLGSALPTAFAHQIDPELAELSFRLSEAKSKMAGAKSDYGPENSEYKTAQRQLEQTQHDYDAKVRGVITGIRTRVAIDRDYLQILQETLRRLKAKG